MKRLLERYADHIDEVVAERPADVDADVARGRRALRRLRARRRTVGVLVAAAAVAAVLAIGNPVRWFAGGDQLATEQTTSNTPTTPPGEADSPTVFLGAAEQVVLVRNSAAWSGLDCRLVPSGWRPVTVQASSVVLVPPDAVAGYSANPTAGAASVLTLRAADSADRINGVAAYRTAGRIIHLGRYADGQRVGQVKLGERWLIARLPQGEPGWTDTTLQRLINSCTLR